jgi:BirA family biotin operon repressor/biotin-[acetyl-CoA-carboxylase] ligase
VPSSESVRQAALVAAFSVAHVLQTLTTLETLVKWPNDLLVRRKKVCGILAETLVFPTRAVLLVGIGINANNRIDEIASPRATSLSQELNHSVNADDLLASVMMEVDQDVSTLAEQGFSPFQPWLQSHLALVGETVTVEFNGQKETGRVLGLSETGALLLADENGLVREVDAGSVYCW